MEAKRNVQRFKVAVVFVAFAILVVLVGVASSAGASDDPGTNLEVPGQEASGDDPERFFDGDHVVPVDLEAVEAEEAERDDWLEGPAAKHEREVSQDAYADLSPSASEDLLRGAFPEQLETLNADPARFLSDAQLIRPLEETAAAVKKDSEYSLMDAGIPVRAEDESGDPDKVELSLEATPEGFEPVNGLVDLSLPGAADQAAEVGEEGVAISQAGADPSPARRFGDKSLFYSDVLPDTDLLVAPTAKGVELFNLLRSEDSPEDLRFAINVPDGAVLRADEGGGAEVVRDGEILTRIAKPVATDAQGTDVPVELAVEGDAVILQVDQRGGDYAFPVLVDPIVEDWANAQNSWYVGNKWDALSNGAWKYASNNSQIKSWICCWEGSHAGLMISSEKNVFYGAKQFGQWSYSTANSKTFITHAWLTPFWRNDESCGSSAEPHDYVGMLWEPGEIWNPVVTGKAKEGTYSLDGNGHAFIIGMGTGNGVWIGCNRYTYAGGVALWLDDQWPPVVSAPTVTPSSGWVSDTGSINIGVNAADEGLGIYRATVTPEGKAAISKTTGCTGLYGNRCPNNTSVNFSLTGLSFGEGVRMNGVSAEDPSGKAASGPKFQTKVDRTPPEVTLSGQLAKATNEGGSTEQPPGVGDDLVLPVYNLNIEATDGSNATDLTKRSGVKNIEVFLDKVKQTVPWMAQTATEDSRPMNKTYELKLSSLTTAGTHTLEVKVRDQVENIRERNIEFEYFPATGMKDEYVMQYFPLPDGSGNEDEEEHPKRPELAVNVMNGNLVYREKDIDVNGAGVDLEVERFYNSMLTTAENTEWGDGWTLAETPELDSIGSGQADVLDSSGAIEDKVGLPTEVGATKFDPVLQATIEKKAGGGYEMTDDTGESATSVSFDATGQAEALLTEGYAKVDYSYEGGELSEIEVEDPATFSAKPEIPTSQLITAPTSSSSFGTNGSGDGQLKAPADVAVDAQGNVWVVDKTNNRIQKFDSSGKYLAKFGSLGSGNGQFNRPTAIAIASNGDLLVTDSGNARVERFNSAGTYLSKFGSAGTGNGQFSGAGPEGIAVDASGNIWVSDTAAGRLQKFSSVGAFIKVAGSKGSGSGQLGEPTGIDVDSSGNVWVADWQNNRISRFNSNGEFLSQFGSLGSSDGQFSHPDEIEIDKLGNVWIGDQGNNRIQQFDLAGQFKAKFGSSGAGQGQFNFAYPMGIASDSKGHLWIADVNNHRIQQWLVPVEKPAYVSSFGSSGAGDGQLKAPADIALAGNSLWVADRNNNRIQKFDTSGNYLAKFGSLGTGNGQFNQPSAVAVDRDGNLLVLDSNNNRVQKFDPSGQFISKFGSAGTGNGQFATPGGVTGDFQGNIWVSDSGNGRLQKFDEEGNFLKIVSSKGTGLGQLGKPAGLDVDPDGNVWVADWSNNRISAFDSNGAYLGSFGSVGSGPGQFNHPNEIEIDSHGNVWICDQENYRVQRFNLKGEYVGQTGVGTFFFAGAAGIASDNLGHLWISDSGESRIQKWMLGNYAPVTAAPLDLSDGDPKVTVETPGALVSKVSGNAAGTHTYTHVGDDLTAHKGPAGETKYEYDASGRMTKVTLPNGTWGSIAYEADGRTKSVTVDPAGSEPVKTTTFEYTDSPTRRTVVVFPDAPHVTYDIGDEGSVLKSWNSLQPPVFDDLSGGLYENRNKEDGLLPGDQYLDIQAHSEEGIASIEVIVNGNQLAHETTCEQTEAQGIECKTVVSEWVSNTESLPPGHLNIEVVITDRLGQRASERFWVDIPEPPPPPAPGTPIPPKFADVLKFREDFGLEKVFPVANEIERNERIFNLINAWYEGEPVARASWERWGVPLRPADVAEMEYRERYVAQAGTAIPNWAEAHAPGTYAGYYVEHREGGVIHVGFTENQAARVAALAQEGGLFAPARLAAFTVAPQHSYADLAGAQGHIGTSLNSLPSFSQALIDVQGNQVKVGTTGSVAGMENALDSVLGTAAPVSAFLDASPPGGNARTDRDRLGGRVRAGDRIKTLEIGWCTAGFGAWQEYTNLEGRKVYKHFLITAGHCGKLSEVFYREAKNPKNGTYEYRDLGKVRRTGLVGPGEVDGLAILLEGDANAWAPREIYLGPKATLPVTGSSTPTPGMIVCTSGVTTDIAPFCGFVQGPPVLLNYTNEPIASWEVPIGLPERPGDSGSPVWEAGTGNAVGLWNAGSSPSFVSPMLPMTTSSEYEAGLAPLAPGIFAKLGFTPGNLSIAP
ncbi:MAG: tripartite motif-containing protein 71 [Solirubrobacterales bacterium]|nr:tripartite motif-containing protein 71 [Solirubrobacterales bacterium]